MKYVIFHVSNATLSSMDKPCAWICSSILINWLIWLGFIMKKNMQTYVTSQLECHSPKISFCFLWLTLQSLCWFSLAPWRRCFFQPIFLPFTEEDLHSTFAMLVAIWLSLHFHHVKGVSHCHHLEGNVKEMY